MKPPAADEGVASRMRRQGERDTRPELAVRQALFAQGLRYRKHFPVPSRPRRTIDIAFTGRRLAVFIDGCFWHGCKVHRAVPTTNREWWQAKLNRNRERDLDTGRALAENGWIVLRFWEHEDLTTVVRTIAGRLRQEADHG